MSKETPKSEMDIEDKGEAPRKESVPWHAMQKEDVFALLGVDKNIRKEGLSTDEAKERLASYGYNQLSEKKKETLLQKIWKQVANVLVGILVFVAVISAVRAFTANVVTNSIQVGIIAGVIM